MGQRQRNGRLSRYAQLDRCFYEGNGCCCGSSQRGAGRNIQQNNVFQYQVSKPRLEPYDLSCVRKEFQRTISSVLFDAYVLNKARELTREFSYRDFLELKHDAFRRIVLRLRRKGKIVANPQRTLPRFYFLADRVDEYLLDRRTTQ